MPLSKDQMPRRTISSNPQQFQVLLRLLDNTENKVNELANILIRMLETNKDFFTKVLKFTDAIQGKNVQWNRVFQDPNDFIQTYKQEIIFYVMESKKQSSSDSKNIHFFEEEEEEKKASASNNRSGNRMSQQIYLDNYDIL